jgi:hypothetical protein
VRWGKVGSSQIRPRVGNGTHVFYSESNESLWKVFKMDSNKIQQVFRLLLLLYRVLVAREGEVNLDRVTKRHCKYLGKTQQWFRLK